jgi:hypothetical protein
MTYIIGNNEDFKVAEVEAPESAKVSDVQKIEYQLSLYNSQQTIPFQSEKLPFLTFIMEHISENSKTILIRDTTFSDVVKEKNIAKPGN